MWTAWLKQEETCMRETENLKRTRNPTLKKSGISFLAVAGTNEFFVRHNF